MMTSSQDKATIIPCTTNMYMKLIILMLQQRQLTDNITAENMKSQADSEGHHYQVFSEVTDNK